MKQICQVIKRPWFVLLVLVSLSCDEESAEVAAKTTTVKVDSLLATLDGCTTLKSPTVDMVYSLDAGTVHENGASLKIEYKFRDSSPQTVGFVTRDFGSLQDWSQYSGIELWSYLRDKAQDLRSVVVVLYEDDGSAYVAEHVRSFDHTGWDKSSVLFSTLVFSPGSSSRSADTPLNLKRIRKIAVGIYQPVRFADKALSIWVADVKLIGGQSNRDLSKRATDGNEGASLASPVVDPLKERLSGWSLNCSANTKLDYAIDNAVTHETDNTLRLKYLFSGDRSSCWGYAIKDLGAVRDWSGYDSIAFASQVPVPARDLVELSIMLYEEDGSAYITQHVRGLKTAGWETSTVPLSQFHIAGAWTKDENSKLDLNQVRKVAVGVFQPTKFADKEFTLYLSVIRATSSAPTSRATQEVSKPVVRRTALQKREPPDGQVYHGAFAFKAPVKGWGEDRRDWESQMDAAQIQEYEQLCGRPVAMVSFFWFLDWEFPKRILGEIHTLNKTPHLGVIVGGITLSDIAAGREDRRLRQWASEAKAYKEAIFLRFLPEMNGNWHLYSEAFDPKQAHETYIKAWRHTVDLFREVGADNVVWVWAPTAIDVGKIPWAQYYPGDAYVDWVGVSVYSFLGNGDPEPQILGIYNDYAARKPIMIAECGAGDADENPKVYKPGQSYYDNPELWINRFFDTLETKASRVKAFVWFNIDRERVWRIQESPKKTAAYKKRLSNGRYGATLQ